MGWKTQPQQYNIRNKKLRLLSSAVLRISWSQIVNKIRIDVVSGSELVVDGDTESRYLVHAFNAVNRTRQLSCRSANLVRSKIDLWADYRCRIVEYCLMCEVEWYNLCIIVTSHTHGSRVIQDGSLMGDRIRHVGPVASHCAYRRELPQLLRRVVITARRRRRSAPLYNDDAVFNLTDRQRVSSRGFLNDRRRQMQPASIMPTDDTALCVPPPLK